MPDDNGVSQDSDALRKDAEYIREMANKFQSQYTKLFDEMTTNLKADVDSSAAWWGPQAQLFLENFNKKEMDFKNAYNNIVNMAENLEEQAQAWDTFEKS